MLATVSLPSMLPSASVHRTPLTALVLACQIAATQCAPLSQCPPHTTDALVLATVPLPIARRSQPPIALVLACQIAVNHRAPLSQCPPHTTDGTCWPIVMWHTRAHTQYPGQTRHWRVKSPLITAPLSQCPPHTTDGAWSPIAARHTHARTPPMHLCWRQCRYPLRRHSTSRRRNTASNTFRSNRRYSLRQHSTSRRRSTPLAILSGQIAVNHRAPLSQCPPHTANVLGRQLQHGTRAHTPNNQVKHGTGACQNRR